MGNIQVPKLDFLTAAKTIVKNVLHQQDKLVTVAYCRTGVQNAKPRGKGKFNPSQHKNLVWERVRSNNATVRRNWVVVQVPRIHLDSLPRTVPIWKDEPTRINDRRIEFDRLGLHLMELQAPLATVSNLMGVRIKATVSEKDYPVWSISDSCFRPVDTQYSLGLIKARAEIKALGTTLGDVLRLPLPKVENLGLTEKALASILKLVRYRNAH